MNFNLNDFKNNFLLELERKFSMKPTNTRIARAI